MYELTLRSRIVTAWSRLYAAEKDSAAAAEQCQEVLKQRPGDRRARRLLADVLQAGRATTRRPWPC
jgi:hypothetical protein